MSLRKEIIVRTIAVTTITLSLRVNKKYSFSCKCESCVTVRHQGLEPMGCILIKSWCILDYRGSHVTPPHSHTGPVQPNCFLKKHLQRLEFGQPCLLSSPTTISMRYLGTIFSYKKSAYRDQKCCCLLIWARCQHMRLDWRHGEKCNSLQEHDPQHI